MIVILDHDSQLGLEREVLITFYEIFLHCRSKYYLTKLQWFEELRSAFVQFLLVLWSSLN